MPKPFLKWAGGKRWLVTTHLDLFPQSYERYIEPFLGSGAVFFALAPKQAVLSDNNEELIATYRAVRDDYAAVVHLLQAHQRAHSNSYYYEVRQSAPRSPATRAARFIYLNRTCFNGLYRVNLNGVFNVPRGTKDNVLFPDDDFAVISQALRSCVIDCGDFASAIKAAQTGDLLYADPPYTVKHNSNNFVKYNQQLFSWADQVRLAEALFEAKERGVQVVLSNANHVSIRSLYAGFGTLLPLARSSVLAADAKKRRRTSELLITNVPPSL
jgi:DNA adenine methylase